MLRYTTTRNFFDQFIHPFKSKLDALNYVIPYVVDRLQAVQAEDAAFDKLTELAYIHPGLQFAIADQDLVRAFRCLHPGQKESMVTWFVNYIDADRSICRLCDIPVPIESEFKKQNAVVDYWLPSQDRLKLAAE